MRTERLSATQSEDLRRAGELLLAGELVAIPTETVYGLAANARNPEAVKKIFIAKNRPADHPLITHIHSPDLLDEWAINLPVWITRVTEEFWPGPLTLIVEKQDWVSDVITGGQSTVGLRMPNQSQLLQILKDNDLAVAAPSANLYQRLSPTSAEQVMAGLDGRIAAVLDGGDCTVGTESTILSVVNGKAKLLRSGAITASQIQALIPVPLEVPTHHYEAVSGNKEIHYQPHTTVVLKSADQLVTGNDSSLNVGLISHSGISECDGVEIVEKLGNDPESYRHDLYATLYALDQKGLDEIWVEMVPVSEQWLDIIDRLQKAST